MSYIGKKNGNPNTDFLEAGGELENHDLVNVDSSGNLLVGKTSAGVAVVGVEARESGLLTATKDNDKPLLLNRTTTNGIIAEFRKDNTTVGSIGTGNGVTTDLILDTRSSYGSGISGAGLAILPMDYTQRADNHTDLGESGTRWKDLYLSGGVYLGGTGSANKLDDYEEGTYTVNFFDSFAGGNQSSSSTTGYYTKVGRLVTISFSEYNLLADNSVSGAVWFSLPFPTNGYSENGQISIRQFNFPSTVMYLVPQASGSAYSRCSIQMVRNGSTSTELTWANISSSTTDIGSLSMTYTTYT